MSDASQGPGWWMASDGKWYPPESKPTGPPPPPPTPPQYPEQSTTPAWLVPTNVSGWAVAAGYLGLVNLICFGILGPLALFTGIMGLRQIRRKPELNGTVRSWVGIIMGALGTVLIVLLILAWSLAD